MTDVCPITSRLQTLIQTLIQTLQHQRQKNLQEATGGERLGRGGREREEVELVISIDGILMGREREEEEEARAARCIMGSSPAV